MEIGKHVKWLLIYKDDTIGKFTLAASYEGPRITRYGISTSWNTSCYESLENTTLDNIYYRILFDKSLSDTILRKSIANARWKYINENQKIPATEWLDMVVPFSDDGHNIKYNMGGYINIKNLNSYDGVSYWTDSDIFGHVCKIQGVITETDDNITHLRNIVSLFGYFIKIEYEKGYSYIICYKYAVGLDSLPKIS